MLNNFYTSKEWIKLTQILKSERVNEDGNIICAYCHKPIVKKYDCICHHTIELNENNVNDYDISLNPDCIELVHHKCHNIIHKRFEGDTHMQYVYLVYGSPCSGKSTYVNEVANKNDLIVDIDRLWLSICNSDKYNKPKCLKQNIFPIRDLLLDQIAKRLGKWKNAYVIGGYPLATERDRIIKKLGAKEVYIDTDEQTCLDRAKTKEWKGYVKDWWEQYRL